MTDKLKRLIKIGGIIVVSVFVTGAVSSSVFFRGTPKINPTFVTKMKNMPSTLAKLPLIIKYSLFGPKTTNTPVVANSNKAAQEVFNNVPKVAPPTGLVFVPVAKGVSAAEDTVTKKKYITISNGVQYVVEETMINGKMYKVLHLVTGQ